MREYNFPQRQRCRQPLAKPSLSGRPLKSRSPNMSTLQNILKQKVKEGELWERLDEKRIRCYACGHCCPIPEGRPGVCRVPFNRRVLWEVVEPVELDC